MSRNIWLSLRSFQADGYPPCGSKTLNARNQDPTILKQIFYAFDRVDMDKFTVNSNITFKKWQNFESKRESTQLWWGAWPKAGINTYQNPMNKSLRWTILFFTPTGIHTPWPMMWRLSSSPVRECSGALG